MSKPEKIPKEVKNSHICDQSPLPLKYHAWSTFEMLLKGIGHTKVVRCKYCGGRPR